MDRHGPSALAATGFVCEPAKAISVIASPSRRPDGRGDGRGVASYFDPALPVAISNAAPVATLFMISSWLLPLPPHCQSSLAAST